MPIPCPCCKADNATGPACRRCKADLSLLFAIEADREAWLIEARWLAANSQFGEAHEAIDRAEGLRSGRGLAKLRAGLFVLARDFRSALSAYNEIAAGTQA